MKIKSVIKGSVFGLWYSRKRLFQNYVAIPIGIITILCVLYGFNELLVNVANVKFPASVLGMLINLVWLTALLGLSNLPQGKIQDPIRKVSGLILTWYLYLIRPLMGFTLKWINVFFIPSFVILPLLDHISIIECLKIAAVFVIGLIFTFVFDAYFVMGLRWITRNFMSRSIEKGDEDEELNSIKSNMHIDITTIDSKSNPIEPDYEQQVSVSANPFRTPSVTSTVTFPEPAYAGQGSKFQPNTSLVSNGEQNSTFEIELNQLSVRRASDVQSEGEINERVSEQGDEANMMDHLDDDAKKTAVWVSTYLDWLIYGLLFVIALPFYYVASIHVLLPYHLAITVIAFYIALLIPQKWPVLKRFAHPIIVSTGIILFVCFIGSLIFHHKPKGFLDDLRYYKTGKNYTNLFSGKVMLNGGKEDTMPKDDFTATPQWPGCGDFLSSLMDVSIVALSLPMYTHRKDFVSNFFYIMPPLLVTSTLTFFLYPLICYNIGIDAERSLGFVGRSVTLALGTPLVLALGGSVPLMAVCTILLGICGVLIGDYLLNFLRVPKDDYATRGVSMGINCGAISTAHLLTTDPRAASMSSLSFLVFGTVMVIFASINGVADVIRGWVGL
ncbi:LrgB family protein [Kocuria palustris]|nr:LrgB family protein [Kocuria palustris]